MRTIVTFIGIITVCFACVRSPEKIDSADIMKQAEEFRNHENYEKAYQLLTPLADQGDLEAIYQLASLYRTGEGENLYYNTTKAIELLYIGAKQDHARSQIGLGLSLQHTLTNYREMDPVKVKRIRKEACEWITKGALQGAELATFGVARCHKTGSFTGTPDYLQAYTWFAVPSFYKKKDAIYDDFNDTLFMRQVAERGKLTHEQKQHALKIAKDIAQQIQAALKKNPIYKY